MKVRLQLYTVPGQVFYNATRRLVLKGVDGVVFVADSQVAGRGAERGVALEPRGRTSRSWASTRARCRSSSSTTSATCATSSRSRRCRRPSTPTARPHFEAAAVHGVGVFETLKEISRLSLDTIRAKIAEEKRSGVAGVAKAAAAAPRRPRRRRPRAPPPPPAPSRRRRRPGPASEPLAVEFAEEDTDKLRVRAGAHAGLARHRQGAREAPRDHGREQDEGAHRGQGPRRGQALPRPHGARRRGRARRSSGRPPSRSRSTS